MVTKYVAKFTELSHLVHDMVNTNAHKARRYQKGLRLEIRVGVQLMGLTTYKEVVNKEKMVEKEVENVDQTKYNMEEKTKLGGQQGGQF